MQVILLSGGSGLRLWPLSNEARSKQFLKLLTNPVTGEKESMVQRVVRQLKETSLGDSITVATSVSQVDSILLQLGIKVNLVVEPSRRDTFPAICLACEYLAKEKEISSDEVVVVMPCDLFINSDFYSCISKLVQIIESKKAELGVIGIKPSYPTAKFGYILPGTKDNGITKVARFVEKPTTVIAKELISQSALWNSGVYAFNLDFLLKHSRRYFDSNSFEEIILNYDLFPKTSVDYEIAEKNGSMSVVTYDGPWNDLGTWNALSKHIKENKYGNVYVDSTEVNTHIINELSVPLVCLGTQNLIVVATPDGILVSDKEKSEQLKDYAHNLVSRPMYEERKWGTYQVLNQTSSINGKYSLTKQLNINPDSYISYQRHNKRTEVWTCVGGIGEVVIDDTRKKFQYGDTVIIPSGHLHTIRAITPLTIIEVQLGTELVEDDIERFPFTW